jgi:hypothetical protein
MMTKVVSIDEGACWSVEDHIDAFWRDELPADATRLLLRHILRCRACLRALREENPMKRRVPGAVRGGQHRLTVTPWPLRSNNPV